MEDITVIGNAEPILSFLAHLDIAGASPKMLNRIIEFLDSGVDPASIEVEYPSTIGTGDIVVSFKPSNGLLDACSALGTLNV